MGWNLGDVFAGIAQGVGSGMTMNAKNEIDTQNQMNMETRRAELDAKRTEAMARLNRELTEPDRKQTQANADRDYSLRSKVADAQIADHSARNDLTSKMNDARAAYLNEKSANDALRAEAAKLKAEGGGVGAGKPVKQDQVLNDVEKLSISRYDEALKAASKARESTPGEMGEKAYAQQTRQAKIDHALEMAQLGAATINPSKDGVVVRTKSGQTVLFKSLEELRAAGLDNPAAEEHFASIKKKQGGDAQKKDAPKSAVNDTGPGVIERAFGAKQNEAQSLAAYMRESAQQDEWKRKQEEFLRRQNAGSTLSPDLQRLNSYRNFQGQ